MLVIALPNDSLRDQMVAAGIQRMVGVQVGTNFPAAEMTDTAIAFHETAGSFCLRLLCHLPILHGGPVTFKCPRKDSNLQPLV
jgi:hypothetical protein